MIQSKCGKRGLYAIFATLAATIVIAAIGLNLFSHNPVSGAPFSKVLENLRAAKTLELRVNKDGQSAAVWVRARFSAD